MPKLALTLLLFAFCGIIHYDGDVRVPMVLYPKHDLERLIKLDKYFDGFRRVKPEERPFEPPPLPRSDPKMKRPGNSFAWYVNEDTGELLYKKVSK